MPAPPYGYRGSTSPRRRAISLLLAAGLVLLVLLALIRLSGLSLPRPRETRPLSTFDVTEAMQGGAKPTATARPKEEHRRTATPPPKPATVPPPPPLPVPSPSPAPPPFITLSRDQFAATDISRYHSDRADTGSDASDGHGSVAAAGPGDGPHGERLYNAEWYRKPRDAELASYMPHTGAPSGAWAMIACRTIERYHVEDCEELGESPQGSGLSRALRQAAWQFLVRPPRVNGKEMVGAWVRIRFTFTPDGHDPGE